MINLVHPNESLYLRKKSGDFYADHRLEWKKIEVENTVIKTNFGEVVFLSESTRLKPIKSNPKRKVHFWTVEFLGKVYEVTRDQMRKNKAFPKTAKLIKDLTKKIVDYVHEKTETLLPSTTVITRPEMYFIYIIPSNYKTLTEMDNGVYDLTEEEEEVIFNERLLAREKMIKEMRESAENGRNNENWLDDVKRSFEEKKHSLKKFFNINNVEQYVEYLINDIQQDVSEEEKKNLYHAYLSLFDKCSSVKETKSLYRRYAKRLHSDLGGDDEDFKALQEAYEVSLKFWEI